jgi:hypothetical protein
MSDCVIWPGYTDSDGYGRCTYRGQKGQLAHRVAYQRVHGPIPPGMDVDHTCFVRPCVNDEHLRPLPLGVNRGLTRRSFKPLCIRGHRLDDEANLIRRRAKPQVRICRACVYERTAGIARAHRRGAST